MYIAATPATLTSLSHSLDNIISGTLLTARGTHNFRTRRHVIHATNRIYRNVDWKATIGESILIDGDLGDTLILDHLERLPLSYRPLTPELEEYADRLVKAMSVGAAIARTYRKSMPHDDVVHIRWNKTVKLKNNRGMIEDAVLHGRLYEGEIELAVALKNGGNHLPIEQASQLMQTLAPSIGIPYLSLAPPKLPAVKKAQKPTGKKYRHWSPLPYESPTEKNMMIMDEVPF